MHEDIQKFFEAGRQLRTKRRTGAFVLVEPDEAVATFLTDCFQEVSCGTLVSFSKPSVALTYLSKQDGKPIKCVILNVQAIGVISPIRILHYLEQNNPEVVSIAYTRDAQQAEQLAKEFPRITMIYHRDGIPSLLECLDIQLKKCGCQQRQRA